METCYFAKLGNHRVGRRYTRSGGPVLAGQHIYEFEYSTTLFKIFPEMYAQ